MRIAQIAPIAERVPPKKYGGTERVIDALTEELVKRGHDVTLFASGDSKTSAKLISVVPQSLREAKVADPYGLNEWTLLNIGYAYKMQEKFDIIHDHTAPTSILSAGLAHTPTVLTMHRPFTENNKVMYQTLDNVNLVAISNAQAKMGKNLNIQGMVYNGLEMNHYPFVEKPDKYLLYIGRLDLEKGVHIAIEVAQRTNMPLIIAGKLDSVWKEFYMEFVEPALEDKRIQWVGEVNEQERNELMSHAYATLHPVTWPEPFGLTMIETMACGSPLVALRQGSIPEVVQHGKTGFVVDTADEMVEAVKKLDQIDRSYCREYALKTFNASKMADAYEAIYEKILAQKDVRHVKIPTTTDIMAPRVRSVKKLSLQ